MMPRDIPAVYRGLKRHFKTHRSPVSDFVATRTNDPFRILVSTVLSARSRDTSTLKVCATLFERIKNFEKLRRFPAAELERVLHPLGFFRAKTRHLKALPEAVERLFGGRIPDTVEELVRLPGVGRKTANLVVSEAFGKPGICVDVHVHRICNRLGLIKTKTPRETEMELRRMLPLRYWRGWNRYLVAFGQTRCLPRNPKCPACPLLRYCVTGRAVMRGS
jgi:endonuclease III